MERERVALRPAQPADVPGIAEIWHLGWRDAHVGNVPDALLTTVAVVDGAVAGFVMIVDDEIEQLYVADRHRGAGVADVLMTRAERQIAAEGHTSAWLADVAGNTRARRFYERAGWRDDGLFDHEAPSEAGPITVPAHRYVKEL
jgi:GNAT superfamily N-acetyltransferase